MENFELIFQNESLSRLASLSLRQWWTIEEEEVEEEEEDFQQSDCKSDSDWGHFQVYQNTEILHWTLNLLKKHLFC